MIKRFVISLAVLAVLFLASLNSVANAAYDSISQDYKIQKAIQILEVNNEQATIDVLVRKNIKVQFTDLGMMSPSYIRYNALAAKDNRGNIYIFIDNKHKDAPAEAIAALLTHEAVHQDDQSSINEETVAWTNEARFWTKVTAQNENLKTIPSALVTRLNTLSEKYQQTGTESIRQLVASNSSYAALPVSSVGY